MGRRRRGDDQSGRFTEINRNRSQRRALENLHAKTIVPVDPQDGPLWNQPGKNSRANVDRDPRHLEDGGKQERRMYKTDEHNRFGKASANRVWDDVAALDRMIENGRNARTVWEIATQPYPEAHFATFPEELPRRCILAGSKEGGTVLDPYAGSGTTLAVARDLARQAVGIEIHQDYLPLIVRRCQQEALPWTQPLGPDTETDTSVVENPPV